MAPQKLSKNVRKRLRDLHAMSNSSNEHEADNARRRLEELMARYGLTREGLDAILKDDDDKPEPEHYNVLNLVDGFVSKYIWISPEQRLFVTLWVLHTYVFDLYNFTPRLVLLSPVFGCGKTTLLILIEQLVSNPLRFIHASAASIFRVLDMPQTILLDEGNNLGLLQDRVLRTVLNGNRRGDKIARAAGSGTRAYNAFTPIAIAAKGHALPNDLVQRSVIVHMQKPPPEAKDNLEPFNESDLEIEMGALRGEIHKWADTCKLNLDPEIPLNWRAGDNWRPLLAIADDLGRGEEAREAALVLSGGLPDEDPALLLLIDIRTIFNTLGVDRISSAQLLEQLHAMESGMWQEWRGPNDDQHPHRLTANELARMLGGRFGGGFGIRPHTIWPRGGRNTRGPSSKGYYRSDFEDAWSRYCGGGTPAHGHTALKFGS
jgi:hypothetical protein